VGLGNRVIAKKALPRKNELRGTLMSLSMCRGQSGGNLCPKSVVCDVTPLGRLAIGSGAMSRDEPIFRPFMSHGAWGKLIL
jgi:hypothetical protein